MRHREESISPPISISPPSLEARCDGWVLEVHDYHSMVSCWLLDDD
jgi:hypothetical protein